MQVSIKRFLKRNLADVGMAQFMTALADKRATHANKECHTVIHTPCITWPHY